jgi:hypothetical protein
MATARGNGRSPKAGRSYDELKEFEGRKYTGMKVGRRHRWKYDAGDWTERKVTPDRWEFQYSVVKRRAGKAPEGSGAPVGTAYRWYILASQVVTKVDANSYTTEMVGIKHKLAHKRAGKEKWSASEAAQRRNLVKLLNEMIADLDQTPADGAATAADGAPRVPRRRARTRATASRRAPAARRVSHPPASRLH